MKEPSMDAQAIEVFTHEPPGVRELYASWAGAGRMGEHFGFIVAVAQGRCIEPLSADLFDLHVMAELAHGYAHKCRLVKDWAYWHAADFVASRRGSARIKDYRLDWGRQAARDGLCSALWEHVRGTGLAARSKQFGVGERPYGRVRERVANAVKLALNDFECELSAAIALDRAG